MTVPAHGDGETPQPLQERFLRLLLNHYVVRHVLDHRSLHDIPYLWNKSLNPSLGETPALSQHLRRSLGRQFRNAIVGHVFAQILVPLDRGLSGSHTVPHTGELEAQQRVVPP